MPSWRPRDEQDRDWAIPMGGQVSLEAKLQRHRDARDAVMGRRCYCPDDCRCRREDNPPCGCREHELRKHGADAVDAEPCACDDDCGHVAYRTPHPSRVTPTGPGHVTGLQPSRRPAKVIREAVDEAWGVRRDECCGDPGDCTESCP